MKILLFGKNGQVGREVQRSLASLGELVAMGSSECDFANPDKVVDAIRSVAPDIIINAAAYTAVDKAESEPEHARLINARTPAVLADEAQKSGAWLVHYSTDYVFDGSGDKPWLETDAPNPLSVYGSTKLEGELAIQSSGCNHLIFRTSWVYAAQGNNFIKTILRLAQERDKLTIVSDQIGAPTGAKLIADVTAKAVDIVQRTPELGGLYHLAASGAVSWYDYARTIVECARRHGATLKVTPEAVLPIPTRDFPTPAKRPPNSWMDTTKLRNSFALHLPDWRQGVESVVAELVKHP